MEIKDKYNPDRFFELEGWYLKERGSFELLARKVASLIEDLIKMHEIEYHSITYRTKDLDSLLTKAEHKNYADPKSEIQDYAGVRIVTFVKSDVLKICELIEREFNIDVENSSDKSGELGEDKVGYRSIHYVAKLNEQRSELAEYSLFKEKCFEIQVRTILEHAWADISHDRTYKFNSILPEKNDIKRRFALASASLEMIDREFDRLNKEIKEYAVEVSKDTEQGNLSHVVIDSTSLMAYMKRKFKEQIDNRLIHPTFKNRDKEIVVELNGVGIYKLDQLDKTINQVIDLNYLTLLNMDKDSSFLSVLRDSLIISDAELYFTKGINEHWSAMEAEGVEILKCLVPDIESILKKFNIYIMRPNDYL